MFLFFYYYKNLAIFYFLLYFFYKLAGYLLHTSIFNVYNWLLYIIRLWHVIVYSGVTNIHRIGKSGVFVGLIWEE